ncbi:hypothetical protein MNBD_GAMMA17-907 [hydrothermal vent metagenome]|uniref:Uncharacterized protein n=1 Tax=hydrothermal vent metagenome TaxID=652676 RepID=A0A3B0ZFU0_9ZZZZ
MNNLTKAVVGVCIIFHPVVAFSASAQADESLESYLKDYHPKTYSAAKKSNADINSLEFSDSNINNDGAAMAAAKSDLRRSPILPRPPSGSARKNCERGGIVGGIFLENNFVATCVSEDGTFGNGYAPLGMTFNPAGTGTVNAPDYLRPGSPHEYFSVTFNQQLFTNNNRNGPTMTGSDNIPTKIRRLDRYPALQEGGVMVTSSIKGEKYAQLDINQKYTLDPNSREIIVRVEMQNTGYGVLKGITYARGLDPDQDRPTTYNTVNRKGHSYFSPGSPVHVKPANMVWASGKHSKLSVALYSVDPIGHDTCVSRTWTTDPIDILSQNCGNPQPVYDVPAGSYGFDYSDSTINIAFKVGRLAPKEKKVFSFKYLFNKEKKYVIPYPKLPKPILPTPIDSAYK